MEYTYYTCDVFTSTRFSGNQLAVIPHADGLTGEQMQAIAREFNFSESTFVFPPDGEGTRKVRIFTPGTEVPFAGHPNIGTAFVLAAAGEIHCSDGATTVVFEEKAGPVPVRIRRDAGGSWECELTAPEPLSVGESLTVEVAASALGLVPMDLFAEVHVPQVASVGLPFVFIQLRDTASLKQIQVNLSVLERIRQTGINPYLFAYAREGFHIRARMFAPLDGVPEDPATGSAGCALAALLTSLEPVASGDFIFHILQGVEMGRPSHLTARSVKENGRIVDTRIAGRCVLISKGILFLDD